MNFGYKLRELRIKNNLTQVQLGNILYISNKAIYKWEMGLSEPCLEMVVTIAKYFNVTTDYLLVDDDYKRIGYSYEDHIIDRWKTPQPKPRFGDVDKPIEIVKGLPDHILKKIINTYLNFNGDKSFIELIIRLSSDVTYLIKLIKGIKAGIYGNKLLFNKLNDIQCYLRPCINQYEDNGSDIWYYLIQIPSKLENIRSIAANERFDDMHCNEMHRLLTNLQKYLSYGFPQQ